MHFVLIVADTCEDAVGRKDQHVERVLPPRTQAHQIRAYSSLDHNVIRFGRIV